MKVLDFGLAKMGGTPTAQGDESPTLTIGQTEAGVILGTASYMSPEQAKGKVVDQRADIYAFGAVLYEMLTGKRLHRGETTTEVLASVIKEEPQWDKVPAQVQKLLRRCLEKDPQKRLRHIGDVMALVDDAPVAQPLSLPHSDAPQAALGPGFDAGLRPSGDLRCAGSLVSQARSPRAGYSLCDVSAARPASVHGQAGDRDIAGRYAVGLFFRSKHRYPSALPTGDGRSGSARDTWNRKRHGPLLFARRPMDRIFRRRKVKKSLSERRTARQPRRCCRGWRQLRRKLGQPGNDCLRTAAE